MATPQQRRSRLLAKLIEVSTSDNRISAFWVEGDQEEAAAAGVLDAHLAIDDAAYEAMAAGSAEFVRTNFGEPAELRAGAPGRFHARFNGEAPVTLDLTLEKVSSLGAKRGQLKIYVDKDDQPDRIYGPE